MRRAPLVLALLVLVLTGCRARERRERREERREERVEARPAERADDRRDARVEARTGWEKLGERMVNFGGVDHDAIVVTAAEGTFRAIRLDVERSALELFDVTVTFGDGETFSPGTRLVFGRDSTSRVIDLPGGQRVIRRVDFRYKNLPGGGRAQIELWAR